MKFRLSRAKTTAAIALTVASALTLVGCSTGGTPASTSGALETDPAKISGDLNFSAWWAYADQALIDGFKAKYPKVNVKLNFTAIDAYPTKIQAQASSNTLPDVFAAQGAFLTSLGEAGKLYNLNDALATDAYDIKGTWKDSFVPNLLSGANSSLAKAETNGETLGVPFNAISVAAVYNKDAYAAAGIQPPTTLAELVSNCKALKTAGYIPLSLTGKVWGDWWARFAFDQTMRDGKAADFKPTDPNYIKAFDIVKQLADAGCWDASQVSTDIAGETSLFLQKKTATFVTVPENFLKAISDGASFQLGTFQIPALNGVTPNQTLGGGNANVLVINKDSKNLSAAVAFAKYLTSSEVQTKLAKDQFTIPSINIQLGSSNPLMAVYLKAAGDGFIDSSAYLPAFSTAGNTTFATQVLPKLYLGQASAADTAAATADLFAK